VAQVLRAEYPSYHPTNSVKALKKTEGSKSSQVSHTTERRVVASFTPAL